MLHDYFRRLSFLYLQVNPKATTVFLLAVYILCLFATYITLIYPGKSYITTWLNDVIGFIDIAHRVSLGEVPYKDFHFIYGPLVALIPGFALYLWGNVGTIFAINGLIVASVLLFSALILLPRRLTAFSALLVILFAWLLIVIPMGNLQSFKDVTWGAFYNRQCWAALIIILVLYIEPVHTGIWGKWLDAVALSLLVLFELGTKIPFALVAIGFILINSIISRYNRQVALRSLLIVTVVVAAEEAVFGLAVPYLNEIIAFSRTLKGGRLEILELISILLDNAPIILASLGAVVASRATGRCSVYDWLYAFGVIASVMLLLTTIGAGAKQGAFAIFVVFICLGELARRAEIQKEKVSPSQAIQSWKTHIVSLGCLFIGAAFIATESGSRLLAWQDFSSKVQNGAPSSDTVSRFSQLLIPDWDKKKHASIGIVTYMKTITEGTNFLLALQQPERTVLTFDMVNPFPYAAGMKPPLNGYPLFWLSSATSSDPNLLPSPKDFLGKVDYVMIPHFPYDNEQFELRMKLYGPYLKQNYILHMKSVYWDMWKLKNENSIAYSADFQMNTGIIN